MSFGFLSCSWKIVFILDRYHIKNNGYKHEFLSNCRGHQYGTIDPIKSNVMIECNREREEFGSSKRFKGIEEMNEKKLTYAEAIHVDEFYTIILIGIIYGELSIPCCQILWKKMKMKRKNALVRMCMM